MHVKKTMPSATAMISNPTEYADNLSASAVVATMIMIGTYAISKTKKEKQAAPKPTRSFKIIFIPYSLFAIQEVERIASQVNLM
jgi:hypothetical protein